VGAFAAGREVRSRHLFKETGQFRRRVLLGFSRVRPNYDDCPAHAALGDRDLVLRPSTGHSTEQNREQVKADARPHGCTSR
jgi:hypothetical protein